MTTSSPHAAPAPIDGDAARFLRAQLSGPSLRIDRRVDAVRGDIVDIGLAGRIGASRYTDPVAMVCLTARSALRAAPDGDATAVSEILFGETFEVFDVEPGWSWGRTVHDHYLGWVAAAALGDPGPAAQWTVTSPLALVFHAADIKAPAMTRLPFGARLSGQKQDGFLAVTGGGFVSLRHVEPLAAPLPIDVARRFTGAPYLWGGRTPQGVDCSGLVQAAFNACGIACPRDSDQQLAALGHAVAFDDRQAGDMVFFPGHVGLLAAPDRLFHANAYWMTTLEEPLADVIARLQAAGVAQPVLGVRRLPSLSA